MWWPLAPLGAGAVRRSVWTSPVPSVARTSIVCSPGRRLPGDRPLHPREARQRARQLGRLPRALVDPDLDAVDLPGRRPRHPGDGDAPGGDRRAVAGHVDARLGLDRALLRPPPRDPVAVEAVERRQLDLGEPLRRRHVAVQARHDEAGGEPVRARGAARRSWSRRRSPGGRRRASPSGSRRSTRRPTARRSGRPPGRGRRGRARRATARPTTTRCRRGRRRPRSTRTTSVMNSSCRGMASRSSKDSSTSRSTIPVIRSDQSAGSTCGTSSAVSIR